MMEERAIREAAAGGAPPTTDASASVEAGRALPLGRRAALEGEARARRIAAPWLRNPFVWAFVIGCLVVTAMRPLLRREPAPPPVIGRVPQFSLVGVDGKPFGSSDLRGHVYVANFFFTRCRSICPAVMKAMATLANEYGADGLDVRVVSISVDPVNDTPARLREAAAGYGADGTRWVLLSGAREAIADLLEKGFRVPFDDANAASGDIAHTGKVVLVDAEGGIRGYYDSDPMGIDEVFHRSKHVLREAANGGHAEAR